MPSFTIQDSVAFVTGTNKANGIGRAIVEALVSNGASKVYATARHASQLDDFVAHHKGKVVAVELDVVADVNTIEHLSELYPDVTLLVNNAGYYGRTSSIGDIDSIQTEMAVNYLAPLAIAKSFSDAFTKNVATPNQPDVKPTALVNIGSAAAFINFPMSGTYSATKAAFHSLTQAQRRDFPNTLVIGVYPSLIDTDMVEGIEMDKAQPSDVALEIVDALLKGTEDVFPDPLAVQFHSDWKRDAKEMERQMAAFTV